MLMCTNAPPPPAAQVLWAQAELLVLKLLSGVQGAQGSLGAAEQGTAFFMRFLVNHRVHLGCGTGCSVQAGSGHGEEGHSQALQSLPRKPVTAEKLWNVPVV